MSLLAEPYQFSVDEFVRLDESGIFGWENRIELLNGTRISMQAEGYRHAQALSALSSELAERAQRRYCTSPRNPVELGKHSMPRPDICLLPRSARNSKRHPQPQEVQIIVEVSDTSLEYDRGPKLAAYALCGIREFWILNLVEDVLEIFRDPVGGVYREQLTVPADGSAAPQAFPDVIISLAEMMPER